MLKGKTEQIAYFDAYHGHIHNPGMGIVSMAVSDHMITGYTKEARIQGDARKPFTLTREMLDEVAALPYIDNLYIRVGWNDVQKEQGKLCLSREFEMAVDTARKNGKSWGFRIMQCSPSNPTEHTLPAFLADKLPMFPFYDGCGYGPQPRKFPLYTEEYLKYWDEMLHLLGEKYDSDPALEYGDLSGFGLWGEGHHGTPVVPGGPVVDVETDTPERTEEVVGKLIRSHQSAFPLTPMVLNLVLSRYKAGQEAIREGCWVRRDSYDQWFEAAEADWGLKKRGDAAMIFETVMPGVLEEDSEDPAFRRSYRRTPNRMCDYGPSYGVVGFNPLDTLHADHMMPELFEPFKNRMGYRLRPSIIWKGERTDGKKCLILGMVNDGTANPPGDILLTAEMEGKKSTVSVNGSCFGDRMHLVELPLPERVVAREVKLSMELKTGEKIRPARFAAETRSGEAPFTLKIQLEHGEKAEGAQKGW